MSEPEELHDPFCCPHGNYLGPSDINGVTYICHECRDGTPSESSEEKAFSLVDVVAPWMILLALFVICSFLYITLF
jgi:hypothetical protein